MSRSGLLMTLTVLLFTSLCAPASLAQDEPGARSAARVFWGTLEAEGLDAAVCKFHEMRDDSSVAYEFNERQFLKLGLSRLLGRDRPAEALVLFRLLVTIFPESPDIWFGLGSAHIMDGNKELAQRSLEKSLTLNPERSPFMDRDPEKSHVKWMLRHIDELMDAAGIEVEYQGKYAPGQQTGIIGPYLGQEPPGSAPKVFAPGIVASLSNEFTITFSPDGKEILFSRMGVGTMFCRWEDRGWTAPAMLNVPGDRPDEDSEANFAPDGSRIFFASYGQVDGARKRLLYEAMREGEGWSEPHCLFPGMYATATGNGTLYFNGSVRPGHDGIVRSRLTDRGHVGPEELPGRPDWAHEGTHPFIAPDESFMLFDARRNGGICLFVSFRQVGGLWTDAFCINDVLDIPRFVGQPSLSPDGEYLFYSFNGDMYWVSAKALHDLRPEGTGRDDGDEVPDRRSDELAEPQQPHALGGRDRDPPG